MKREREREREDEDLRHSEQMRLPHADEADEKCAITCFSHSRNTEYGMRSTENGSRLRSRKGRLSWHTTMYVP